MKPQKPGELYPVPVSLPLFPSIPAQSLLTVLPGLPLTPSCPLSPGFVNGNGMGARAFPGAEAQPGEDTWTKLGFKEGRRGRS